MSRIAIATGNHFQDTDGSFVEHWRTNIIFSIARASAGNSAEAARRHNLRLAEQQTHQ